MTHSINAIAIRVSNVKALDALRNNPAVVNIFPDRTLREEVRPQTPIQPTNLSGVVTSSTVDLSWSDNSSNEDGFRIERCVGTSCSPEALIGTTSSNDNTFTDATVSPNMAYRYRVLAYIDGGPPTLEKISDPSNVVEVTTNDAGGPPPPPPPPPPVSTGNIRQIVPVGVHRVGTAVPGSDGDGIGVAVLDTGIDINQPDLALAPESFSAFGGSAQDDRGHGTHVAGIISALDNNRGVVGVAPGARLYAVKVLDATGSGDESQVIAGLDWVFVNRDNFSPPIRVVNMSLGRALEPGESIDDTGFPMRQEIQALYNEGIVVVVSAGNDYTLEAIDQVPAAFPEVLAVAGSVAESGGNDAICSPFAPLVSADSASYFTSDGAFVGSAGVTISAPSEERQDVFSPDGGFSCVVAIHGIRSTQLIQDPSSLGPNTVISSRLTPSGEAIGTSFAAPHVSGVVARIMQMGLVTATGDLEVEGIRNWIRANADRRDSAPVEPLGLVPAPLDQPLNPGYSFDGEREGIVQAPYPTQ